MDPDPACHFAADPVPDPTFPFDADPNPSFRIKTQKNLEKCLSWLIFQILVLTVFAGHLQTDADLDPAYHFNTDRDTDPTYHANADPDPTFQFDADPDHNTASENELLFLLLIKRIGISKKLVCIIQVPVHYPPLN